MSLFSKTIPSVIMPCALCTEQSDISDKGVHLSFCCENPICSECLLKPLPSPTFCLICCLPQRLSESGILYAQESLKYIFPDKHWHERKKQIDAFFETARRMPGCSFFFIGISIPGKIWTHQRLPKNTNFFAKTCIKQPLYSVGLGFARFVVIQLFHAQNRISCIPRILFFHGL